MISTLVKQQSQGYAALICDAGVPVMGIDPDGNYKFLNLTTGGGTLAEQPESASLTSYLVAPTSIPLSIIPALPKAVGTLLGTVNVHPILTVSAGQYKITPNLIIGTSTATGIGAVNFLLYKTGSTFSTYMGTVSVDSPVTPTLADMADGLVGVWTSIHLWALGTGNTQITNVDQNASMIKSLYLPIGTYVLAAVVSTSITLTSVTGYLGVSEFNKIG